MGEYKRGDLRSGSGHTVTDRRQAIAIAISQADRRCQWVEPARLQAYRNIRRGAITPRRRTLTRVKGYTKKNGTRVAAHARSPDRRKRRK